jgi:hypothetical protein
MASLINSDPAIATVHSAVIKYVSRKPCFASHCRKYVDL